MIRLFGGSGLLGALIAVPDDDSDQQVQPIGGLKCSHPVVESRRNALIEINTALPPVLLAACAAIRPYHLTPSEAPIR